MARGQNRELSELERLAVLRHLSRGRHFGGGSMFGGGRGRKRRGDVRAALLLLLADEPRNGYQLMQAVEERSGGRWRPSPGSVYPTLAQLEDEGLIRTTGGDAARAFELTDAGREHLEHQTGREAPWEVDGDDPGRQLFDSLHSLVGQVHLAAMEVARAGDARQLTHAVEVLSRSKRELYRILAEDDG